MVSEFDVAYEDLETPNAGDALSSRAHLADVNFVFFAYCDWAASSAAFVLGVSRGSFFRADCTFSPLLSRGWLLLASSKA